MINFRYFFSTSITSFFGLRRPSLIRNICFMQKMSDFLLEEMSVDHTERIYRQEISHYHSEAVHLTSISKCRLKKREKVNGFICI